jgi:DNA-binding response OmpR family regulator
MVLSVDAHAPETVLVVDDDRNIVHLVTLYLAKAGYRVIPAYTGAEALRKVRECNPDLLVLDIMLPGQDGLEVCRSLRRNSEIPIVILSARGTDLDKVAGLQFGADDYVTKPFHPAELVARVQSVLRRTRSRGVAPAPTRIALGKLTLDVGQRVAAVAGQPIQLRPKEFDLLATFCRLPGFVLDRDRLLDLVWGHEFTGDNRTVDVHIAWLREKLQGSGLHIQTVWGIGYKIVEDGDPTAAAR